MKRQVVFGLIAVVTACAASQLCAQHRGGAARPVYSPGGDRVLNGGRNGSHDRSRRDHHYDGYGYLPYDSGYPYMMDDYADADAFGQQPEVYSPPPEPLVQPAAPPSAERPARPKVTEYKWPATGPYTLTKTSEAEAPDFAIVLKNGSTLSAVTIFAEEDGLHYVDSDDRAGLVSMSEVDRAATLKLNRARNLNLYLPAAQ